MQVYYGLYTDNGDMYSGGDKQTLMTAVAQHANQADGAETVRWRRRATRRPATLPPPGCGWSMPRPTTSSSASPQRKKIWEEGAAAREALLRAKGVKTPLKMPTGQALQDQINNALWSDWH